MRLWIEFGVGSGERRSLPAIGCGLHLSLCGVLVQIPSGAWVRVIGAAASLECRVHLGGETLVTEEWD